MNASRRRRISYLLLIVALFTTQVFVAQGLQSEAIRSKLAQESLGDVDPVSGTAQLVCFGFRGVAVTFLWNEVIELNRKERFFEIRPLLNSITLLQPNFHSPWQYQAWNMAYNICNTWESVDDKYYWIKEGAKFMQEACAKNKNAPDLDWYAGWIYLNRFTVHDDHMYFREVFRRSVEDPDHPYRDEKFTANKQRRPDPFECAYDWFLSANDIVIGQEKQPKRMGITPFLTGPAKARTTYAEFQEKEGRFGVDTIQAWNEAHREWLKYGRGFNVARKPDVEERYQFVHRLEYDASEFENLSADTKYWIDRFGNIVRYRYWKMRSKAEATEDMEGGREAFYLAEKLRREEGNYEESLKKYEAGFPKWKRLFAVEEFSQLREDVPIVEESQTWEKNYLQTLSKLGMPSPENRPFAGVFDPMPEPFKPPTSGEYINPTTNTPTGGLPGSMDSVLPQTPLSDPTKKKKN